jgi:hypothetical protein
VLALGKPTVLALVHGGAMSLGPLKAAAPAILDCFYGGEIRPGPLKSFRHRPVYFIRNSVYKYTGRRQDDFKVDA